MVSNFSWKLLLISIVLISTIDTAYYPIDGVGNNVVNAKWGSFNSSLIRKGPANYLDGREEMQNSLPNPRNVSNMLAAVVKTRLNPRLITVMHNAWAQLVSFDLFDSDQVSEDISIAVTPDDPYLSTAIIQKREKYALNSNGTRSPVSASTQFLDASFLYGSTLDHAKILRSGVAGRLRLESDNSLPVFTDKDALVIQMENPLNLTSKIRLCGYSKCNSNPEILALINIFAIEHNRKASDYLIKNSTLTDEELYQKARRWVIGLFQMITYREYLPAVLGRPMSRYELQPYNSSFNPSIFVEFSHCAMNYFHAEHTGSIVTMREGLVTISGITPTRNTFYRPDFTYETGVDDILRGMVVQVVKNVSPKYVDDYRNMLNGIVPGMPKDDLFSMDIQRSRDAGIPFYNDLRALYSLPRVKGFSEITSNPDIAKKLADLYGTPDKMDAIVGGLAENIAIGQSVGSLFKSIITDQFTRIRSSDRFWYEAPGQFNISELLEMKDSPLSVVIQRNTGVKMIQRNAFYADPEQVSAATSASLLTGYDLFPDYNQTLWKNITYLAPYYRMAWSVSSDLTKISFRVDALSNGYVGLGFGPKGFDAMARVDVALGWRSFSGKLQVDDCWAYAIGAPLPDANFGGKNDFTDTFFNTSNGVSTMIFTRNVTSSDPVDNSIPIGKEMRITFATHKTSLDLSYHGPNRGYADLILIKNPPTSTTIHYLKMQDSVAIANYCMLAVGMIVLSLIAAGLIFYRKTNIIRATSTNFSLITISGMILCFISLCTQIGAPTHLSCIADAIILPLGYSIMIGAIIAKTYRIRVIFDNHSKTVNRGVDDYHLVLGTFVFVVVELALLLILVLIYTPIPTIVPLPGDQAQFICQSPNSIIGLVLTVYNGILLGTAGVFAFLTRNVYQQFRESGSIAFSVYNAIITAIVVLPLQVIEADLKFKIAAKSVGVFYSVLMAAILFWGQKLYRVSIIGDDLSTKSKSGGLSLSKVSAKEIPKIGSQNQSSLPMKISQG